MFLAMPFILLFCIAISMIGNAWIPLSVKSVLYALSLSIKSVLIFLLPIIIFALLFRAAVQLSRYATKIILFIIAAVCCSNFFSTMISHLIGCWVYTFDLSLTLPDTVHELVPAWSLALPKLIPTDLAMLAGVLLGIILPRMRPLYVAQLSYLLNNIVSRLLKFFTYIIPLFVIGFVIKLDYEGVMSIIIRDYATILVVIAVTQFSYISIMYLIANNGKVHRTMQTILNMLPATITGFSTMSSAAAMPLTIVGTEKNTHNVDFARSIIPATVNIHLIGDCFAIPIFAYAVLKTYSISSPTFVTYLIFAAQFVLAKFSVAAIPGGGIIVMLPILERYLGFNSEMMSLITALYILFDPVITSANVLGNGGFAMLMDKLYTVFMQYNKHKIH